MVPIGTSILVFRFDGTENQQTPNIKLNSFYLRRNNEN